LQLRLEYVARAEALEAKVAQDGVLLTVPLPRLPPSFPRDLELQRLMGTHRMFGKMTVVVLAETKKQHGTGFQDCRQRAAIVWPNASRAMSLTVPPSCPRGDRNSVALNVSSR
jgi:protoporphyrinogen oxidase